MKGFHHLMVVKNEDTYGNVVEPYNVETLTIPYFKEDINKSVASEDEQVIFSNSREVSMPVKGTVEVDGSLDIPIDASSICFWLFFLTGSKETVSGNSKFVPCSSNLPSFYAEFGKNVQGNLVKRIEGIKVNELKIDIEPTGTLKGSVSVICRDLYLESNTSNFLLIPESETVYRPFQNFSAKIKVDGIEVGYISQINVTYSNSLEPVRTVGDGGKVSVLSEGGFAANGSLKALVDETFVNKSINMIPVTLETEISQVIGNETHVLKMVLSKVELSQPKISVDGPNSFVYCDMDFKAYHENGLGTEFHYNITNNS